MPELPEVETIVRLLAPRMCGQTIVGVRRLDPRVAGLAGAPGRGSGLGKNRGDSLLAGRRIMEVGRRGKALIISLSPPGALVFRLGMTGHLRLIPAGSPLTGPHIHAALSLSGDRDLVYTDPRRFGRILVDGDSPHPDLGLAPDPFSPDFTWEGLAGRGGRSKRPLKTVVMDQGVVSGIGNIYAAEILHRAGLSPLTRADRVARPAWRRLAREAQRVLEKAIKAGGSSVRDFVDPEGLAGSFQKSHLVYGREGEKCRKCGATIRRVVQGGRSTFYCAGCQK